MGVRGGGESGAGRSGGQVARDSKNEREEERRAIEDAVIERKGGASIGSVVKGLADGRDYDRQCFVGHTQRQTPDVDNVVYFTSDGEVRSGEFYDVGITERDGIDLIGRTI